MSYHAALLETSDWPLYDALVRRSPHGSVWSYASWQSAHAAAPAVVGVFKGRELVGGGSFPVVDGNVARYTAGLPWTGPVGRDRTEGECQEIARQVAECLLARYGEVTLTCPPEWTDIRPFLWMGMRAHVRYTYRGMTNQYEKRVKIRPLEYEKLKSDFDFSEHWICGRHKYDDSSVYFVRDNRCWYYLMANRGGTWHAELVNEMIRTAKLQGRDVDLVGANGPSISLFKRGFGLPLVPYYAVTTSDAKDLREATYGG